MHVMDILDLPNISRPDITVMVDWALKINNLSQTSGIIRPHEYNMLLVVGTSCSENGTIMSVLFYAFLKVHIYIYVYVKGIISL